MVGLSDSDDGDVSLNHGSFDCWIVKLDNLGVIEWQKSLGGSDWDDALSVQQTFDDGYIIAGSSSSENGDVTENHGGGWVGGGVGADGGAGAVLGGRGCDAQAAGVPWGDRGVGEGGGDGEGARGGDRVQALCVCAGWEG